MENQPDPSWVYYHALYHLVAHWGACVALIALIVTVGLVAASQREVASKGLFYLAIIAPTGMVLYFLLRMYQFGNIVNAKLPPSYVKDHEWIPSPYNLIVGAVMTVVIATAEIVLVCRKQQR